MSLLLILTGSGGGISADLSVTEAGDTLASAAVVAIQATVAVTEQGDTLSSTAAVAVQATLSATEQGDTLSAAATVSIQATLSNGTEDGDTLSSTASVVTVLQDNTGGYLKHVGRLRREDEEVMRLVLEAITKIAA